MSQALQNTINKAVAYTFEHFNIAFESDDFFTDNSSPIMLTIATKQLFLLPNKNAQNSFTIMMILAELPHLTMAEKLNLLQETMMLNGPQWQQPVTYSIDPQQQYVYVSSNVLIDSDTTQHTGEALVNSIQKLLTIYDNSLNYLNLTAVNLSKN